MNPLKLTPCLPVKVEMVYLTNLLIPRERIIYTHIKPSGIDKSPFSDKTYMFVTCLMVDIFIDGITKIMTFKSLLDFGVNLH